MKQMRLDVGSDGSMLAIGESMERLSSYVPRSAKVIVTDATVRALHGHRFPPWNVVEIGIGEGSKTLETVDSIYEAFLQEGLDRSSFVVAVGGGIVCDVAGFAASTYLRGLPFGFVPTTLLAQVDAAVGGKNGVNLKGYKNLVGTFTQPRFVLCDFDVLKTLPREEVANGFAEVIKHAAIADNSLFTFLEAHVEEALSLDSAVTGRIVHDCLRIKGGIVAGDEREKGERRKLNFGHTLGHAFEKVLHLRHGEAVSLGMAAAARLSAARGLLPYEDVDRLERLLVRFGLPIRARSDGDLIWDALIKDKKRDHGQIHFVLLDAIGSARVLPVGNDELKGVLHDLC